MKTKLLCGIASTIILSACGQPEPISYESLSLINNYYVQHPVQTLTPTAGGWLFRGARDYGSEIRVSFLVPGSLNPDKAKRHAVLERVCPAESDLLWKILPSGNKIVINVYTEDSKFKDRVIC